LGKKKPDATEIASGFYVFNLEFITYTVQPRRNARGV